MLSPEVKACLKLSRLVQSLCSPSQDGVDSVFKCTVAVPISLKDYAVRLGTYMRCSEASFVSAAVLAQRLFDLNPGLFCERSVHKILCTSTLVSLKFNDDKFFSNAYYAECAGVSCQELNFLELSLVKMLDFRVFVSSKDYCAALKAMDGCDSSLASPSSLDCFGGELEATKPGVDDFFRNASEVVFSVYNSVVG